jgi:hypothetical protein
LQKIAAAVKIANDMKLRNNNTNTASAGSVKRRRSSRLGSKLEKTGAAPAVAKLSSKAKTRKTKVQEEEEEVVVVDDSHPSASTSNSKAGGSDGDGGNSKLEEKTKKKRNPVTILDHITVIPGNNGNHLSHLILILYSSIGNKLQSTNHFLPIPIPFQVKSLCSSAMSVLRNSRQRHT